LAEKASVDSIADDPPKDQLVRAAKSLAFVILRAIDELQPPEMLAHSIAVAHDCIKAYGATDPSEPIADVLRNPLNRSN
jgi:hypothetical protein